MWIIKYSRQAVKDSKKIQQANLKKNVVRLIEILKVNPFQIPPPYEKLVGGFDRCLFPMNQYTTPFGLRSFPFRGSCSYPADVEPLRINSFFCKK